jgi:hypothetical protein
LNLVYLLGAARCIANPRKPSLPRLKKIAVLPWLPTAAPTLSCIALMIRYVTRRASPSACSDGLRAGADVVLKELFAAGIARNPMFRPIRSMMYPV